MVKGVTLKDKPNKKHQTVTVYNKDLLPEVLYKGILKRSKGVIKTDLDEVEFPAFPYDLWLIIIDYTPIDTLLRLEKTCQAMYSLLNPQCDK